MINRHCFKAQISGCFAQPCHATQDHKDWRAGETEEATAGALRDASSDLEGAVMMPGPRCGGCKGRTGCGTPAGLAGAEKPATLVILRGLFLLIEEGGDTQLRSPFTCATGY